MTGVICHVLSGLTILGLFNCVSALICLSCQDVGRPNLCEYYDTCEDDEVCVVQQYLQENEVRYSLGCSLKNRCGHVRNNSLRSTDLDVFCQECCTGDFCNSGGCNMPGFPATRGPICYNCDGISTGSVCHRISVCSQHEECYYSIHSRFGYENTFVSSKCQRSHVCDALRGASTVIGRRQVDFFHNCAKCCTTDLCNNECDNTMTTQQKRLTTSSAKIRTTTERTTTSTEDIKTTLAPTEVTSRTTSKATTSLVDDKTTLTPAEVTTRTTSEITTSPVDDKTTLTTTEVTTRTTSKATTSPVDDKTTLTTTEVTTRTTSKATTSPVDDHKTTLTPTEVTTSTSSKATTSPVDDKTTLAPTKVTTITTSKATTSPVDGTSSTGHRYMIMFLINFGHPDRSLQIVLAANSAGWCIIQDNFHNTVRNMTLTKGINSFTVTKDMVMDKNVIGKKSIIIETSIIVSVYSFNLEQYTSDGVLNIPTQQCSTRYIVPSYEPDSFHLSAFGFGSLQNDNEVIVSLRLTSGTVVISGHSYSNGDTITLKLQENETFQFASRYDLTGTKIHSSKPVCVVSGTQCAHLGSGSCSHLSEMILPVQDFSYIFLIPILQTRPNIVVRVFANEEQALLKFNNQSITLSGRDDHTFTLSGTYSHYLLSSKPILIMLYAAGVSKGDPFMMTIPSVTQYLSDYVFAVVDAGFRSYLSVIVQGSKADGLRLDNHILAPISNSAISIDVTGTQYTSFSVSVSPGYHRMIHIHNETFGLFVYGNRIVDGYGYPAGIHL